MYLVPNTLVERLTAKRYAVYSPQDADLAVFVTGCSSGIGRHAALSLAAAGYHVFATVRKEADAHSLLQEHQEQFKDAPFLYPVICDVADPQQINQARDHVSAWLQDETPTTKPRVLMGIVNNAGVAPALNLIEHLDVERDMEPTMLVNLYAAIRVYQSFLPLLRQSLEKNVPGSPRVINVGSLAGSAARPFRGPYTLSKFAMEGLTDTIRQELSQENIAVVCISAAYISTTLGQKNVAKTKSSYGENMHHEDLTDMQKRLFQGLVTAYLHAFDVAPGPEASTQAILEALTSDKPMTRYYPGTVGKLPGWLVSKVMRLLPVSTVDSMAAPLAPVKE